jgi:DNA-binding response OmpR family regulator
LAVASKVLVVEDDQGLIGELEDALRSEGYDVVVAHDGVEALRVAQTEEPDLVILDPMLAWLGGARVRQRPRGGAVTGEPFIVMSPKSQQQERILPTCADVGGHLKRSVDAQGLLTRIKALQQRARPKKPAILREGVLEIDLERWTVTVGGKTATLTPKEFGLLRMLMNAKGRVLSRAVLWEIVWEHGRELQFGSRAVDVHIGRLRQKLGPAGAYIVTVRDVGYRFAVAEPH